MATSSVSRTRATNITGLIDIDALVEANTLRQKTKINAATQNLKVEQYKQEQYREIQKKAKTFYNKYFDIATGTSLFNSSTYNSMKATAVDSTVATATASTQAKAGSYEVEVVKAAKSAKSEISKSDLLSLRGETIQISINGKDSEFKLKDSGTEKEIAEDLNNQLKASGVKLTATYTELYGTDGGMILKSDTAGVSGNFTVELKNATVSSGTTSASKFTVKQGVDSEIKITDLTTNQNKTYKGSNEINVDGITFNIDENAQENSKTRINIKSDGSELAKKVKEFVDDYNELMGSINTKLYEARNKSYMPLTDDDKEGLSDSEIEKLEKKAQEGLLRNDSYLRNFADDMKQSMATVFTSGSNKGLNLKDFGITPVNDYSAQNGIYTVDEEALLKAIEENPDKLKSLFTDGDGVITKLKSNLYDHATSSFSKLAGKAGVEGGVSANTNEMTKDIEQRKKLITQMQTALKEKEDALYSRYSKLESSLSSLQSQQSSLASYFQ